MALFVNRHIPPAAKVHGKELKPGEVIQETDVYDSSDGTWRKAGLAYSGTRVPEGDHVTWVRPDSSK